MSNPRDDFDRIAAAWLADGPVELPDRVLDTALDEVHRFPRRRPIAPWRTRSMAPLLKITGIAAALVVAVLAGSLLMNRVAMPSVGASPTPSTAASSTAAPATSPPTATATVARPLGGSGRLEPGVYTSDLVRPMLALELGAGWEVVFHDSRLLILGRTGFDRQLVVMNPESVVDPASGSSIGLPDDLAAWLEAHPGLEIDASTETSLGGLTGRRIDGRPGPQANFDAAGELALLGATAVRDVVVASDQVFAFSVLDAEDPLVVGLIARADGFGDFEDEARPVLDSIWARN